MRTTPHSTLLNAGRRGLLKKGLVGGALLSLGGAGWLAFRGSKLIALPPEGLQVLSPRQYAVVHALAECLIRPQPPFPSVEELRVAFEVDKILVKVDVTARDEVTALLELFENGLAQALFGARTQPFTQLSLDERERVAFEWRDSRLAVRRTGFRALRGLVMAAYFGNPKSHAAANYPGPPSAFHDPEAPVWKGVEE